MSELGEKIIARVRFHAGELPDFVYVAPGNGTCVYVDGGCPSCIVGRALWDLDLIGPDLETDLTEVREPGRYGSVVRVNKADVLSLLPHLGIELDDYEVRWLKTVQSQQDSRLNWGGAVLYADVWTKP